MKGKHTNETRQKMSQSQKQRWQEMPQEKRNEIKAKQSQAQQQKQMAYKFVIENKGWLIDAVKRENKKREKERAKIGK